MEDKVYQITLADGTVLENLKRNGDCFISETEIDDSVFADNCTEVTISDGETTEVLENAEMISAASTDGTSWFAFRQLSDEELARMKLQSDIEYIAMMASIEI